jgi:hypothetical protein
MLRQSAALVGLQPIMDNLRFAQEIVSRKCLKMMQGWSVEKMRRIMNEDPSPELKNKESIKFDIAVQEGVLTDTQQQIFFRQMLELKELGEPMPPGFLARIAPVQGKTEYMQAMEEWNKSQQQQMAQVQQLEMEKHRNQAQLFQSQSISNLASAKERFTRSVANLGLEDERVSKSSDNRADATLKRAQALKEIEAMDDERVMRLFDMFVRLEELDRAKDEMMKAEDVSISDAINKQQQEVNNAREI